MAILLSRTAPNRRSVRWPCTDCCSTLSGWGTRDYLPAPARVLRRGKEATLALRPIRRKAGATVAAAPVHLQGGCPAELQGSDDGRDRVQDDAAQYLHRDADGLDGVRNDGADSQG